MLSIFFFFMVKVVLLQNLDEQFCNLKDVEKVWTVDGRWMNKMGLAAISFDTSHVITTGGFIKPEPRSNHLGVASK